MGVCGAVCVGVRGGRCVWVCARGDVRVSGGVRVRDEVQADAQKGWYVRQGAGVVAHQGVAEVDALPMRVR